MFISDDLQCQVLKALADETRLRLLRLLFREELSVLELVEILDVLQSKVSRHLSILKSSEMVEDRRDGNRIFYKLKVFKNNLSHFNDLISKIGSSDHPDLERLDVILKNRIVNISGEKVEEWDKNLANLYNPLTALPALAELAPRGLIIADFGTGTGKMLPVLSRLASKVYAIDHSLDMLKFAKNRCDQLGIKNVEFMQADVTDSKFSMPYCDAVMLHFVIHQLPSPSAVINKVASFLKPKGRLVVIDRLKHEDEMSRDKFGSVWLGFEQSQLLEWFSNANLVDMHWSTNDELKTPVRVFTCSGERPSF